MTKLGGLLMLIAFAILAFILSPLFLADNQPVLNILEPILCAPGERLSMDVIVTRDFEGTGYSSDYDCMRPDETTYNVTEKAFVLGAAAFSAPFLVGLLLFIAGINRAVRGVVPSRTVEIYSGGASMPLSVGATQVHVTTPSQSYSFDVTADAASSPNLATRLKQLREAYDAGMITHTEYERTKADMLRDFSDVG